METCQELYTSFALKSTGKLLHLSQAMKHHDGENEQVQVALFERCMMQSSSKGNIGIPFGFELKYSFMDNPPSILLDKMQEKVTYFLYSQADLKKWREILSQKINQRGFHEQFKPRKRIGKANLSSIYLVQKPQNGKKYAVKALSKNFVYSEEKGKESLIKKIEIMRSLSHNNCMKLLQVFESENSIYMVMELLEGGTLSDKIKDQNILKQNNFQPNQTKQIISSILRGLQEMHSKNIMHRSLKPQNLMFRQEGSWDCIIGGFGIAEFSNQQEYLYVRCGTPGYIAPQIINIIGVDTKYEPICDIYSLGVIFHILLLGVMPFTGTTQAQLIQQNRASNITFQGVRYKSLHPNALNLLVRMLQKDPWKRISAAGSLKHPYLNDRLVSVPSLSSMNSCIYQPPTSKLQQYKERQLRFTIEDGQVKCVEKLKNCDSANIDKDNSS